MKKIKDLWWIEIMVLFLCISSCQSCENLKNIEKHLEKIEQRLQIK